MTIHPSADNRQTYAPRGVRRLHANMTKRWGAHGAPTAVNECESHGIYVSVRSMQDWLAGRSTPNPDTALKLHDAFFSDNARARKLASKLSQIAAELADIQASL